MSSTSSVPSTTAPTVRARSSVSRTSGMTSQGGRPTASNAVRRLACLRQGRLYPRQVGGRLEAERPFPTHEGVRVPGEEALDLGPLDPAAAGN